MSRRNGTSEKNECRRNESRRNGTNHRRNGSRRNGSRQNGNRSFIHVPTIFLFIKRQAKVKAIITLYKTLSFRTEKSRNMTDANEDRVDVTTDTTSGDPNSHEHRVLTPSLYRVIHYDSCH